MINPFRNWIVGNPWDGVEGDVADIGSIAFATCLKAIGITAQEHRTTSVLLYGEPGSGKTHLIRRVRAHLAAKRRAEVSKPMFVYIRLSTSASMIWRHIRRCLADDLLRPIDTDGSQLHGLLMRRLARPSSRGRLLDDWRREVPAGAPWNEDGFATALDTILRRINPAELEKLEIFDRLDGEDELPWALRQVLRHMVHRRYGDLTGAWLRGDSLPEEHLKSLGIPSDEDYDGDPEDRAKRTVLALARFAGPGSPIVLCLDQLEALDTDTGFQSLARAVSTLHDETKNLVLVSCVQTSWRDILMRFKSDFARFAEFEAHLPLLTRDQAARLLQSRRAAIEGPELAGVSPLWPFEEADLVRLFDQAGLASARTILSKASERFDRMGPPARPPLDPAETEWRQRLDEASRTLAHADMDEVLDHGLRSLVSVKGAPWSITEGSGDIEFRLRGPAGEAEVSLCNRRNMTSLAAKLKRLKTFQVGNPQARIILVRDPRLAIGKHARACRTYLDGLTGAGARLIHPPLEALAALDALRQLLADAKSGDLTAIQPDTVAEWLARHLPAPLESLLEEIAGNAAAVPPQDASKREDLLELIEQRCVIAAADAARELHMSTGEILGLVADAPDLAGLLGGPPPILYRLVPAAPTQ